MSKYDIAYKGPGKTVAASNGFNVMTQLEKGRKVQYSLQMGKWCKTSKRNGFGL